MKLTIEELRKVHDEAEAKAWDEMPHYMSHTDDSFLSRIRDASILAVARFVAERQRAVEPTEEMIDAPRQIILYSETPGRSVKGLREHLELAGVEYQSWFPEWAKTETGHLTKAGIAILVYRAMQSVAPLG